jgi:hypothetical protein
VCDDEVTSCAFTHPTMQHRTGSKTSAEATISNAPTQVRCACAFVAGCSTRLRSHYDCSLYCISEQMMRI